MRRAARPCSDPAQPGGAACRLIATVVGLVAVMAAASTLRAPITAVPPVLELIGEELAGTGRSGDSVALGVLAAIPLIGFSLASLLAPPMLRRAGPERSLLIALMVLSVAILIRSAPPAAALWIGTALVGAAIAIGNVVLPVIVKTRWPRGVAATTGAYTAASALAAALSAAIVIPMTRELGGDWRAALAVGAGFAALAALVWLAAFGRAARPLQDTDRASVHRGPIGASRTTVTRSPLAWAVMTYMGLQAATYYTLLAWIPTIERAVGIGPEESGWHLAAFIGIGIVSGILASIAAQVLPDQRWLSALSSAVLVLAVCGALTAPHWAIVWIVIAGISCGAVFPVAVAFIGLRSASSVTTASLSAFVQFGGYLIAALGPGLAGLIAAATGGWVWSLVMIAVIACAQAVLGFVVGANRLVDPN